MIWNYLINFGNDMGGIVFVGIMYRYSGMEGVFCILLDFNKLGIFFFKEIKILFKENK